MTASLSVNLASAFKRADELTSLADHAGHAGIAGKMERRRGDEGGKCPLAFLQASHASGWAKSHNSPLYPLSIYSSNSNYLLYVYVAVRFVWHVALTVKIYYRSLQKTDTV